MASPRKRNRSSSTRLAERLGLLWRRTLGVVNGVFLLAALLALLAPWISPADVPLLGFLGLAVPILLAGILFWIGFWIVFYVRYALPNLVVLLLHLPNLTSWVQLSSPDAADISLRVVSHNVNAFYNRTDRFLQTLEALRELKPDILLLQEYYANDNRTFGPITDTLQEVLGLRHVAFMPLYAPHFGLAIFSRYPIERSGRVWPERVDTLVTNGIQFADLRLYGERLRIYNIHLQSYFTTAAANDRNHVPFQQPQRAHHFRALLGALPAAWQVQQSQLGALKTHRAACAHLQLLGGDLNNPPFGYAYFQTTRGLTDTFRAKGRAWGATYRHPYLRYRIDLLAVDPAFDVLDHRRCDSSPSDHAPLVAEVFFRDQPLEEAVY